MNMKELQTLVKSLELEGYQAQITLFDGDVLTTVKGDHMVVEWNGGIGYGQSYEDAMKAASDDSWRRIQDQQHQH